MANLLWYLQRLTWPIDILDILLVAFVFFWFLYLVRGTRAVPLLRGVILFVIVVALLGNAIRLRAFGWLIQSAIPALIVAIPVVFQQELRRALERLGRAGTLVGGRTRGERAALEQTLAEIVQACRTLSERRHGALIVLERETGLQELADSGVPLDALITHTEAVQRPIRDTQQRIPGPSELRIPHLYQPSRGSMTTDPPGILLTEVARGK